MRTLFEYLRPSTTSEAVAIKALHGDAALFWAGGTDITLHWKQERHRPSYCIDLAYLDGLDDITIEPTKIRIGAKTTLRTLDRSGYRHPLLATLERVAKLMCTPQTRSLATVGRNLCTASPAADLSPVLVAMGAEAVIEGESDTRRLPLVEFFEGVNRTALRNGELLREIVIPGVPEIRSAASYRRIDRTVVDIALVNAGVWIAADDAASIVAARIALGAVAPVILIAQGNRF